MYLLCPDLASFRANQPRPLRDVWRTVNNDFGSYKRKQNQRRRRGQTDDPDVAVSDEAAYVHTRERALRRRHDVKTMQSPSPTPTPPTSTSTSAPASGPHPGLPALSAAGRLSCIRETFGDDCFPWAYWASQDSIAEHRLTGYYLTERQWLNRVGQLMATLGDASHVDSWSQRALDRRPFEDQDIVEAGRAAALPCRPDAAELFQRHVASALERLQRTIHAQLRVVEVGGDHAPSLEQVTLPSRAPHPPASHSAQRVAVSHAPDTSALVSAAVEDEASLVDYEEGELVPDCVAPSSAGSTLPTTEQSADEGGESEMPQAQAAVSEQQPQPPQQPLTVLPLSTSSSSSSSSASPHSVMEAMRRVSFDSAEFVNPRHASRRWQLSYRGKGTFAQVYVGKAVHVHGTDYPAPVAIKLALDPSSQSMARQQLVHEAEMMERVARVSPHAVCQLVFQPRGRDAVVMMQSGAQQQPVFIAMELVDYDLGELQRSGLLSRSAMCEGLLLSFLALQAVHRSGVLHRDLKLNNLAFCVNHAADLVTAARSDVCSEDTRLSARILDLGEAVPLRAGEAGPTRYGQCRSEYASIARHSSEEQGFKDDVEMLLYAFLDKLMARGLPWKQQQQRDGSPRLSRGEMRRKKVDFRRCTAAERSERRLIAMLSTLDHTHARAAPPYQQLEAAVRSAWQDEWEEHESRGARSPRRLYDCIQLLRQR